MNKRSIKNKHTFVSLIHKSILALFSYGFIKKDCCPCSFINKIY